MSTYDQEVVSDITYVDFHTVVLPFCWMIVADLMIITALFSFKKYSSYVHATMGLMIWALTLGLALPFLIEHGINHPESRVHSHKIMGVTVLVCGSFQCAVGLLGKFFQRDPTANSVLIYVLRKIHLCHGYAILLLAKATGFLLIYGASYVIFVCLLCWQTLFIGLILTYKLCTPTLSDTIHPTHKKNHHQLIRKITSTQQIRQHTTQFIIFGNMVYDVSPLISTHPCGYYIVNCVSGKQIDRYVYGMYSSQSQPSLPMHNHSARSFELLETPIACIDIASPYEDFIENMEFRISFKQAISAEENVYLLGVIPKNFNMFEYSGYSDIRQLGRNYTLTIDGCTRLYTSVNCYSRRNLKLMSKILSTEISNERSQGSDVQMTDMNVINSSRTLPTSVHGNNYLPLVVKCYPKGKLTPKLINLTHNDTLTMSPPNGQGLQLSMCKPGRIIIVVGGTGLNPFCDLIDLIFKCRIIEDESQFKGELIEKDPILSEKPFKHLRFLLMGAFLSPNSIHAVTMQQIIRLSKNPCFEVIFRFKNEFGFKVAKNCHIKLTNENFIRILETELKTDYSKVLVCGPPGMTESVSNFLDGEHVTEYRLI